jgi:hypothetical protein
MTAVFPGGVCVPVENVGLIRVSTMRSQALKSGGRRFLLPAAICAMVILAGCGTVRAPVSPAPSRSAATSPATSASVSSPATPHAGTATWRLLPAAPAVAPQGSLVSVWTGSQMLIRGVVSPPGGPPKAVLLSYTPSSGVWRTLAPGPAPHAVEGWDNAVWTGTEMLVFGPDGNGAYNPVSNTWRPIAQNMFAELGSVRVWTGRQEIFWGGGCCDEALAGGAAYTPATNTWQALPRSPLSARYTSGVWTGTEIIIAGGFSPTTGPPRLFADAAAYNPATRTWRKLPPMPEPRSDATAVWDGTEALFIAGTRAGADGPSADGVAFNPATGHWRRLPAMAYTRSGFAAVWTGRQVLIWGGLTGPYASHKVPPHGVAYDPAANRWSALPMSPLRGRNMPTAVWTGQQMIVWGGFIPTAQQDEPLTDGAAYRPVSS